MKVTLRKANALQQAITDTIRTTQSQITSTVTIDEFENARNKIADVSAEFYTLLNKQQGLYKALYEIRDLVGKANTKEINANLTQISLLEKLIQLYSGLSNASASTNIEVVEGKLEKIKNSPADTRSVYSRSETVTTGVLSQDEIKNLKSKANGYKKSKQKLQDEVLELNISTTIELSEGVVELLKQADIL